MTACTLAGNGSVYFLFCSKHCFPSAVAHCEPTGVSLHSRLLIDCQTECFTKCIEHTNNYVSVLPSVPWTMHEHARAGGALLDNAACSCQLQVQELSQIGFSST